MPLLKKLESEFSKLKNQIYKEKHAELIRDVGAIQNGTSATLIAKCQEAKNKYRARIEKAQKIRQYSLCAAKKDYAAEQYAVDVQYLHDLSAQRAKQRAPIVQENWLLDEAKIMAESYIGIYH